MQVAIAGAHGKIALHLLRRLTARGETVIGLIRNPDHGEDVQARGGHPVVCDLEHATVKDVAAAIAGCQAAVFAAGAGPGSGVDRKLTVDRDGAIKLLDGAADAGVRRYLIVSSVGAESPPEGNDAFSVYLRAKAEADTAVKASDREWTIVRPGRLTDEPGSGRVRLERDPFRGEVPRADVAAVIEALLHDPRASGRTLYVNGGDQDIMPAIDAAFA